MESAAPWVLSAQEVVQQQRTSLERGLSTEEVEKRRQRYGTNELQKEPGKPMWRLILEQFDDMLVKVGVLLRQQHCGVLRLTRTTARQL